MIQPRVLKGFRDSLPKQELVKKYIISTLESEFQKYGFVPIDTPVLEYTEVLLGKGNGETDKQIFSFKDNGKRDVAMRYDLTVPFARFMAEHKNELSLPFKRFHIAKVWRGENPQKGRYREFFQCDFDIVGIDSGYADYEILSMMHSSLSSLGLKRFTIRIAHRGLFNDFLNAIGCLPYSVEILRCVDKLRKIGTVEVFEQLKVISGSSDSAQAIMDYITVEGQKTNREILAQLDRLAGGTSEHARRLHTILSLLEDNGIEASFCIDPSITRGLDYYTGIVYETFLDDLIEIGSVCSGGRYNELASLYTNEHIPGVGSSIGLDRLISALEDLDSDLLTQSSSADVIILNQDSECIPHGFKLASQLRALSIRCDHFLADKKLAAQFKYAESNNIPFAILFSQDECDQGLCTLRNLATRSDTNRLNIFEVAKIIKDGRN
ncbi:MAG: histidine--tRNA ligase [Sphaerochaetaceae bacterium]